MMGNRKLIQICISLALVGIVALTAGQARASEARIISLSNNPMVMNLTDVVDYPGLLNIYSNTAFLNVYANVPDGNVGAFIGDNVTFGVWVHRSQRWQDLDETSRIFNLDLPDTHDLFDFYLGTRGGFGIRLTMSAGLDTLEQEGPDPNDNDLSSDGASTFAFDIAPGFSFDRKAYHGDFGLGITFSHFQVAQSGEASQTTLWIPSFLLRHRSIIGPRDEVINGVIDVILTRRAYSAKTQGDNKVKSSVGRWVTTIVGGPQFKLPQNFTVWTGLQFQLEHVSGTYENETDETKVLPVTGIGAPGVVLSGELLLWDMLAIRAGVNYDVYWTIAQEDSDQNVPGGDDDPEFVDREMGHRFSWSSGLGVLLGSFQLDATISQQLYFDGPNLVGGRAPGLFGIISAAYMW